MELVPERRRAQEVEQAVDRQLPRPFPLLPAHARVARRVQPAAYAVCRARMEGERAAGELRGDNRWI